MPSSLWHFANPPVRLPTTLTDTNRSFLLEPPVFWTLEIARTHEPGGKPDTFPTGTNGIFSSKPVAGPDCQGCLRSPGFRYNRSIRCRQFW